MAYHRATDLEMTRTIAVWGPGLPTAVVHGLVPDAPARNEVVLHLIDGRRVSGRIGDDTAIRSLADAGRAVRGLLGPHGPLTRRGNALPLTTAEHTWVLTRESARGLVVHRREGGGEAGDRGGTGDRGETGAPIEVARTSGDVLELAAAATPLDVVAALTLHAFRVDTSVLASLGA